MRKSYWKKRGRTLTSGYRKEEEEFKKFVESNVSRSTCEDCAEYMSKTHD